MPRISTCYWRGSQNLSVSLWHSRMSFFNGLQRIEDAIWPCGPTLRYLDISYWDLEATMFRHHHREMADLSDMVVLKEIRVSSLINKSWTPLDWIIPRSLTRIRIPGLDFFCNESKATQCILV